jgi:hypothetical protein
MAEGMGKEMMIGWTHKRFGKIRREKDVKMHKIGGDYGPCYFRCIMH